MDGVCRFSRDHVVECSERTVLSCLEPVCLYWRHFGRYFSYHLARSDGWPAWKHCLLVIGCLFLHSDWMMCVFTSDPPLVSVQETRCVESCMIFH